MSRRRCCFCSMRRTLGAVSPAWCCSRRTSPLRSPCRFGVRDNSDDRSNRPIRMRYFPLMQRLSLTKCSLIVTFAVGSAAQLLVFGWGDSSHSGSVSSRLAPEYARISDGSDECCLQNNSEMSAKFRMQSDSMNSPDNNVNVIANNKSATSPCLQMGLTST